MIEIRHIDYSCINAEGNEINGEAVNAIYIDDNSLWITSEPFDTEKTKCKLYITFDITKEFIQEMKALIMVMENIFEEIDDDSRD